MSQEARNVVPFSAAGPGEAIHEELEKLLVYMNRCPRLQSEHAVLEHPARDFPDVWQWDFNQVRLVPASGRVDRIVTSFSDEPTLGGEVMQLFAEVKVDSSWHGKTILFPRTIFVTKGWGKAILGCYLDEGGTCTQEILPFTKFFDGRVFVATWKR